MPSSVFVLFDAPSMARITPRRVHAAISAVLDLPEGVSVERAASFENLAHRPIHDAPGAKPYSLGQLTQVNDTLGMELRFLDDRLLSTLDAWLAWGGILRIGSGGSDTVALVAKEAEVVLQRSWEELAAITHNTTWEVSLVTPMVLTSRGEHVNGVTPASLATSLQQRWHKWNPQTAPPRPLHSDMARVLTTVTTPTVPASRSAFPAVTGVGVSPRTTSPLHKATFESPGLRVHHRHRSSPSSWLCLHSPTSVHIRAMAWASSTPYRWGEAHMDVIGTVVGALTTPMNR